MTDEELLERFLGGASYSIIAMELGVTRACIAGRIFRFRRKSGTKVKKEPPKKTKPYVPVRRSNLSVSVATTVGRFFKPKPPEMTKNEMREELRQAVLNTMPK